MEACAPNLQALIGDTVGARLISHAGSLTSLSKYPASTVQILGAEKALFRALKTKGNTPKYGLIFHSTFIGRAAAKNKGRISRYLANKCSIASRIDAFSETPVSASSLGTQHSAPGDCAPPAPASVPVRYLWFACVRVRGGWASIPHRRASLAPDRALPCSCPCRCRGRRANLASD